ncbi:unnamed protein product [Closterium sp. Naga37s-1]|nr:unnamed protein product [Closterium sp. Naga37s-1]
MTTPYVSCGEPSPHRPTSSGRAPLRTALDAQFRHDRNLPVTHDAYVRFRSSAQVTAGKTGPADAGGQENGPRDEESRAVGALQDGVNAEPGTDIQTRGVQANADERNSERANDDDASGGHGTGSVTPRDEANEATSANETQRDDRRGGSPAYRHEPPMNDVEANAPGVPQPLRRIARRTPHARAPSDVRTCPRVEPARAADPRSGDGSDQRTPVEQQARSRQGAQEGANVERDRSPRCNRGPVAKEIHWPTLKAPHQHERSRQRRPPRRDRRHLWQPHRGADGEARGGEARDEERAEDRGEQAKRQGDLPANCRTQSGRAEFVIHAVRDLTSAQPSSLVLQLDLENAFNSVERSAFFNALTNSPLAPLIPFTRSFYATPSPLLLDPRLSSTALISGRGVRQGDPLRPLLFAASIQQHLRRVAAEHPDFTVLAYADEITMIGPATATLGAQRVLTPLLAQDGLTCNFRKSSAWSSTPLGGDVLPEGLPLTHEGVRVLGSHVGSQSFFSDFVRSTLTDAAAPLGSLASIHPQHALLLLSRCISRRIGYILRTTPADVLPLSEWHAWCSELLNTALTAASIQPPRREAEINFLLRQANLPVALGGLGLTDPTTEAAPAYLASTTEALQLLRSLDLPATAALGANNNALQPSAAHSVTIQDMEGRLPPLALQNLQEHQQTPSQDQLQRALSQEVHAAKADALTEESRTIQERLTMPKLLVGAANDEVLALDDT